MSTRWQVKKKDGAVLLGVVTARLWFDAREEACQLYGVDRGEIEVLALPDEPTSNGKGT